MTDALHEPGVALVLRLADGRGVGGVEVDPSSVPWPPTASASGRSSVSSLVMLALRVHEARCQNWRAWVLARSWVSAMRSGSAAQGAPRSRRRSIGTSDAMLLRSERLRERPVGLGAEAERGALVVGQVAARRRRRPRRR